MKFKKIIVFCILISCIILTASTVEASENNNTDSLTINENIFDEFEITNNNENIQEITPDDTLQSKEINGMFYDMELEILADDTTITDYDEKMITVRVENLDYDPENEGTGDQYPAIMLINFNILKDGKYLTNFDKLTDGLGYIRFSSSVLPSESGTYTVIAKYTPSDGAHRFSINYEDGHSETYDEFLPTEKTFIIKKILPLHEWTVTGKWAGQEYTVTIKLTEQQYNTLKNAKNNKKTKEIGPIHTKKYITVKTTKTKKLVIYKITQNKKTGKINEKWTKKWKSKAKKLIKQGYKSQLHKKLSKTNGKIWLTFKKTYKKKYEIKATVLTVAKNGQYQKGDYITLYSAEPMTAKKITI